MAKQSIETSPQTTKNSSSSPSAEMHHRHREKQRRQKTDDEILIQLLARRSFHLPGRSWKEDWIQWMRNNHIVIGTCLHDPLHPIETWERIIVLAGSVSFALLATNIGYVWDWCEDCEEFDPNEVVYSWYMSAGDNPEDERTLDITYGMIILWTFGCAFHSIFDILVWNLSACACCHPGGRFGDSDVAVRCKDLGSYSLIPPILGLGGVAAYSSYLRITTENDELRQEYEDDLVDTVTSGRLGEYSFLLRFGVELTLAWFVFSPILSTLLFSGILGCCGRLPLLGGRPRHKRLLEEQLGGDETGGVGTPNGNSHFYARF